VNPGVAERYSDEFDAAARHDRIRRD